MADPSAWTRQKLRLSICPLWWRPPLSLMRNVCAQVLPAGAALTIPINPPMEPGELPFVFTVLGHESVVIRVVDSQRAIIHNPTDRSSPFLFFVARQPTVPVWLQTAMRILGGS